MAIHFSVLTWEIPWTEEPGGLQSMGSQRVRHDLATTREQLKDQSILKERFYAHFEIKIKPWSKTNFCKVLHFIAVGIKRFILILLDLYQEKTRKYITFLHWRRKW